MDYWVSPTDVSNAVWIAIALVVIVALKMAPSALYGETEFIFSSIKVITITGLIGESRSPSDVADMDVLHTEGNIQYWESRSIAGRNRMGNTSGSGTGTIL